MLIRMAEGHGIAKSWQPLDGISPHLRHAVIAAEDNLFCEHGGFDWEALRGEVEKFMQGDRPRGASTITMQTAKNLLLWPGRDPVRKALEGWFTPQLELFWPKRRILEVYLNIVELGPGHYGAEAAARRYFGKPAADLTRDEAARLAVILPAPLHRNPLSGSAGHGRRVATILRRIDHLGPLLVCAA